MVRLLAILCCALVMLVGYWPTSGELPAGKSPAEFGQGARPLLFQKPILLAANEQGLAAAPPTIGRPAHAPPTGMTDKQVQMVTSVFVGLLVTGYFFLRRQHACVDN